MWFFRAVGFDLDGTLAVDDRVAPRVLDAIDRARGDRAVLLVTGRIHRDLDRDFPGLAEHFDAVVTENGAVLSTALGRRRLHEPVDHAVDAELRARDVPFSRGEVILAIDGRDARTAVDVLVGLGLDHQVVHNRGAAMVLPAGVTKGAALVAALDELGLSPHNAVAVGDAENDLSLLRSAEVGVAVANAVPSLAEHADLVLPLPDGDGVVGLLGGPILSGHERFCPPRRRVAIGWYDDDTPVTLPASQSSVLVAGDTGAGKSYLAGLLAERWIDAGYAVLVVDPEGDHRGLAGRAGVHLVDAAAHLPEPHDLMALMQPRHTSLVLDLSHLDVEAQLDYLRRLPDALLAQRISHGVPHWVIYEEAHQRSWISDGSGLAPGVAEAGTCLVTWQPERLPPELLHTIETTITLDLPVGAPTDGERHGTVATGGASATFRVGKRSSPHVRHRRKYAATPLPVERRFHFRGTRRADAAPATMEEFGHRLLECDPETLDYHLSRGDFSRWVTEGLADRVLGSEFGRIEVDLLGRRAASVERARQQLYDALERRYLRG